MPERLGKYEIIGELGRGGMGVVYKARDPLLERFVVIKTISPGLLGDEAFKRRFYREARAAALLHHPNIVTIYELSEDQGIPYIAMEFLPGRSLESLIRAGLRMVLPKQLEIISQVAQALAFAHRNGIVHRDVKPANIMLISDGAAKVLDFGIARITSSSATQTGMVVGTLNYMAPELISGEQADSRSDIFSLGVVLYEFLAYQHPFQAANTAALLLRIVNEAPPPIRELVTDCPEELASLVEKALAKKRADRYQSMEELLQDLHPIYVGASAAVADRLLEEARRSVALRQWVPAKSYLEQTLGIDASRRTARVLLEQVREELRQEALRLQFEPHIEAARGFLRCRQYEEAVKECRQVLAEDADHPQAKELLGEAQVALEQRAGIEAQLRNAGEWVAAGELALAEEAVARVLQLDPANGQARELLATVQAEVQKREVRRRLRYGIVRVKNLMDQNSFEEARASLENLATEFPEEPEIGRLRSELGESRLRQQIEARLAAARGLMSQRKFSEAEGECRAVLAVECSNAEAMNLLSEAQLQRDFQKLIGRRLEGARRAAQAGRLEDARNEIRKILELEPENEEARILQQQVGAQVEQQERRRKFDEDLARAKDFIEKSDYDQAAALLERLESEYPEEAEPRRVRSWARQKAEYEELDRWTRDQLVRARTLVEQKELDLALAVSDGILARNPKNVEANDLKLAVAKARAEAETAREAASRARLADSALEPAPARVVDASPARAPVAPPERPAAPAPLGPQTQAPPTLRPQPAAEPPSAGPAPPETPDLASAEGRSPASRDISVRESASLPRVRQPFREPLVPFSMTMMTARPEVHSTKIIKWSAVALVLCGVAFGIYEIYQRWEQAEAPSATTQAKRPELSAEKSMLRGKVADTQGRLLDGATIHLRNLKTREIREASAMFGGTYTFSELTPGEYQLSVKLAGSEKLRLAGTITIAANEVAYKDLVIPKTGHPSIVASPENQAREKPADHEAATRCGSGSVREPNASTSESLTISGYVRDDQGKGLAAVRIEAVAASGAVVGSTRTESSGLYYLAGIAPGSYKIRFTPPSGYLPRSISMPDLYAGKLYEVNTALRRAN